METCAFCERTINNVCRMIKSPKRNVFICDDCICISHTIISNCINQNSAAHMRKKMVENWGLEMVDPKRKANDIAINKMTPSELHQQLDRFIIGQEHAKRVLSVAIYNHNKRLHDKTGLIKKSNILLAGPSGCGKTLLARTLAKMLDVPFATADATSLTEAGYVGDDVETCLQRLLDVADGDLELAQKGVVFIDEIDKIARVSENRSITRDVSGEGVQSSLLKLIEGCEVNVQTTGRRKHPNGPNVKFNTANVLFICGGAFEGLFENNKRNPLGFGASNAFDVIDADKAAYEKLTQESLVKFGMMPELVGRLPVLCALTELKEDDLVRVLTEPEDAITKEYELLFKKDGIKLSFEEDSLREIAKIAIEKKTGARGLRTILEDVMLDIMYDIPDNKDHIAKCIVTKESITTKKVEIVEKRTRKKTAVAASS